MKTKRFMKLLLAALALLLCSSTTVYTNSSVDDPFKALKCESIEGNIGVNCFFSGNGRYYDYALLHEFNVEDITAYQPERRLLEAYRNDTGWDIENTYDGSIFQITNSAVSNGTVTFEIGGYPTTVSRGTIIEFTFRVITNNGVAKEVSYLYSPDLNEFLWCKSGPCAIPNSTVKIEMVGSTPNKPVLEKDFCKSNIPNTLEIVTIETESYYYSEGLCPYLYR